MSRSRLDEQGAAAYASDAKAHKWQLGKFRRPAGEPNILADDGQLFWVKLGPPQAGAHPETGEAFDVYEARCARYPGQTGKVRASAIELLGEFSDADEPERELSADPLSHRCPLCGQGLPRLRKAEPWERACLLCGGPRGS
jgi:hypothetical protein